jgi:PKD repeat protein
MKKLVLLSVVFILLAACKKEPSSNFTTLGALEAGVSIAFNNLSENADSWSWDFGDGTISTEKSPNHTFEKAGVYSVSLTASGNGKSAVYYQNLIIKGTTFAFLNNTSATLYDFFTFYNNGHYLMEYKHHGVLNQDHQTLTIRTDYSLISFGFSFITGGQVFICSTPYTLTSNTHNLLIITDTIGIIPVTISSHNLKRTGTDNDLKTIMNTLVQK